MKKHHKPRTRILSLALVAMMLLSLLPTSVFAAPAAATRRTTMLNLLGISDTNTQGAIYDADDNSYTNDAEKWVYDATGKVLYLNGVDFNIPSSSADSAAITIPGDATISVEKGSTNNIFVDKTSAYGIRAFASSALPTDSTLTIEIGGDAAGTDPARLNISSGLAALSGTNNNDGCNLTTVLDGVNVTLESSDASPIETEQFEIKSGSLYATGNDKCINAGETDVPLITIPDEYQILGSTLKKAPNADLAVAAVNTDKMYIQMGADGTGDFAKTVKLTPFDRCFLSFADGELLMGEVDDTMSPVDPDKLGGWSVDGTTLTLNNFTFETDAPIALEMEDGGTLAFSGTNTLSSGNQSIPGSNAISLSLNNKGIFALGDLTISGSNDSAVLNVNSGSITVGEMPNITSVAGGSSAIWAQKITVTKGIVNANAGAVTLASGGNIPEPWVSSTAISTSEYKQSGGAVEAKAAAATIESSPVGSVGLSTSIFAMDGGELVASGKYVAMFISGQELNVDHLNIVGNVNSDAPGTVKLKKANLSNLWSFIADSNTSSSPSLADLAKYVKCTVGGGGNEGNTVSGLITDKGVELAGATVTLSQNGLEKYRTTTDANGKYKLTNVQNGLYTLYVKNPDNTLITDSVFVNGASVTKGANFSGSKRNTYAQGDVGFVVGGLSALINNQNIDKILSAAELAAVNNGGGMALIFTSKIKGSGDTDQDDALLSKSPLTSGKILDVLMDLRVTKEVKDKDNNILTLGEPIPTLLQPIELMMPLSNELIGKEGIVVLRVHNGVVEALSNNKNDEEYYEIIENGTMIRLVVKNFSTYVFAYNNPNGGGGGGGGGGNGGNGYYTGTGNGTWNPGTGNLPQPGDRLPSFTDVTKTDWYYDAVMTAVAKGWFTGTSQTTFGPNETTTRGMIATILHRMAGSPIVTASNFGDVATGTWYTSGIAWAQNNGIVTGYGNNKFGPNDNVTREQLASILYRYAKMKGIDQSKLASLDGFADGKSVSTYSQDAMRWAVAAGLISGRDGKTLAPKATATRAEVATIMVRFLQLYGM